MKQTLVPQDVSRGLGTPEETADACPRRLVSARPAPRQPNRLQPLLDPPPYEPWRGYATPDFNLDVHDELRIPLLGLGPARWQWAAGSAEDFHVELKTAHADLSFSQPCTVPEQFKPSLSANDVSADRKKVNRYRKEVPLLIHYLGSQPPASCSDLASTVAIAATSDAENQQAGMKPDGSSV